MSQSAPGARPVVVEDASDLSELGYKQELHRGLGPFASFAAGFSFVSILTTVFAFFAIGVAFGGPAFAWTWPIVFVGQFAVSLVFAELSARYPIAGAVYQWSRRLSNDPLGWFAGWFMLTGYIVSVAALAVAMQTVLPSLWGGFQLIGTDPAVTSPSGAANAILLGSVTILICTVISALGVSLMGRITIIGVTIEIIGAALMVVLLFANAERGPGVILETGGVQGEGSYLWPFLASMLMATYVMYGFDSAAELSEETGDPRRTAPRAIIQAMLISAIGGGLMIMSALMAAPSITAPELSTQGIAWVLTSQLDTWMAKLLLAIVAVAIFSAVLAIQSSAARVMFSMARDGRLPYAQVLSRVNPKTSTPVYTGVTVSALAIAILVVNLGQSSVFAAVAAVSVVVVYLAYLMVTGPALWHRLRGSDAASAPAGYFTLGRWGVPINLVAVGFGAFFLVDIAWPRAAVYDPGGEGHWYLQYFPILFVTALLVTGLLAYRRMLREHGIPTHGVLDLTHPRDAATGEPVLHHTQDEPPRLP